MKNTPDKKLEEILHNNNIAGMSVAVTDRNKTIYSKGFGCCNALFPHIITTDETLYRIASITKVVTGLTLMKLYEDKVLDINSPVSQYVPWLKLPGDAQKRITLLHLLSHTSGLPKEYTPDGPREESALENSLKNELGKVNLEFMPEDGKYLYSNLGIRLASYVAERLTGKPYTLLAKEYVINPLEMTQTTYDLRVAATYSLSIPHADSENGPTPQHYIQENAARMAAGGLYSNVTDLTKLLRMMLNEGKSDKGKAIISAESLGKMMSPITMQRDEEGGGYGIAMMTQSYKDGSMAGHLGNASPYGGGLFADTKKGYGAVVLMNTFRKDLRTDIPRMILEML